jgi:hypothetical protein
MNRQARFDYSPLGWQADAVWGNAYWRAEKEDWQGSWAVFYYGGMAAWAARAARAAWERDRSCRQRAALSGWRAARHSLQLPP